MYFSHSTVEAPLHVLLVEDNPDDAALVRHTFLRAKQDQWKLAQVERLGEAIKICKEYRSGVGKDFDAILLDLRLPDSTGLDTIIRLREAMPEIPVVILTGLDDESLAIDSIRAGAQDYLTKDGITIQQLVRSVKFAIERKRSN